MGGTAVGGKRVSVSVGLTLANGVKKILGDSVTKFSVAGSIRRRADMFDPESYKETVGDIDIVVIPRKASSGQGYNFWHRMADTFKQDPDPKRQKYSFKYRGVQVDILVTNANSWGAALMHMTGPVELNIKQRAKAKALGLMLNEKGLWSPTDGLIAGATERDVYEALETPLIAPTDREKTECRQTR